MSDKCSEGIWALLLALNLSSFPEPNLLAPTLSHTHSPLLRLWGRLLFALRFGSSKMPRFPGISPLRNCWIDQFLRVEAIITWFNLLNPATPKVSCDRNRGGGEHQYKDLRRVGDILRSRKRWGFRICRGCWHKRRKFYWNRCRRMTSINTRRMLRGKCSFVLTREERKCWFYSGQVLFCCWRQRVPLRWKWWRQNREHRRLSYRLAKSKIKHVTYLWRMIKRI